ncbi:MAG: hypothetical protein R6V56_04815 [Lentisphaeria bacterium]
MSDSTKSKGLLKRTVFAWGVFAGIVTLPIALILFNTVFKSAPEPATKPITISQPAPKKNATVENQPQPKPTATPYTYRVVKKRYSSYANTKRMVYSVYLNTQQTPDQERMRATAQQIWRNGNKKWDDFIVQMIFGPIENFDTGAYGIADFSPSGIVDFSINEVPLKMLAYNEKKPAAEDAPPSPRKTSN